MMFVYVEMRVCLLAVVLIEQNENVNEILIELVLILLILDEMSLLFELNLHLSDKVVHYEFLFDFDIYTQIEEELINNKSNILIAIDKN
jgi:hypothetical protein